MNEIRSVFCYGSITILVTSAHSLNRNGNIHFSRRFFLITTYHRIPIYTSNIKVMHVELNKIISDHMRKPRFLVRFVLLSLQFSFQIFFLECCFLFSSFFDYCHCVVSKLIINTRHTCYYARSACRLQKTDQCT